MLRRWWSPELVCRRLSFDGFSTAPPLARHRVLAPEKSIAAAGTSKKRIHAPRSHSCRRRGTVGSGRDIKNALRLGGLPPIAPPPSRVHADAESICCLLSEPSNQRQSVGELLRAHCGKLHSDLVLHVLYSYRKLGRARTLEFFSWAGTHLHFRLDDTVVEYMADFFGRRKLFDDLRCLLRTVRSSQGTVSTRAIAIFVRFLGRQGRVEEALALFEGMEEEFNCPPDNLVFNNVLYVLCKMCLAGNSIEIALVLFRKIRCPDEYSYSNLLAGLCRCGRTDDALKLFDEMARSQLVPTRSAANVLVGQLTESGVKSEAVEKVSVRGLRRPFEILVPNVRAKIGMKPAVEIFWTLWKLRLLPSAFVINRLISELCHLGKIDEAVPILYAAGDVKHISFAESYTAVMKALCQARRMDAAGELLERMISLRLKPKVADFSSIICAFCKLGRLEAADKYLRIMNSQRCEPDSAIFTALIHAHVGIQSWEVAHDLLLEMIGLGLRPHFETYKLVDGFLRGKGRTDLCVKLEAKMETQMLLRQCRTGKLEVALETLSRMVDKGIYPPIYTVGTLKHTFRGCSKRKELWKLIDKMGAAPPPD